MKRSELDIKLKISESTEDILNLSDAEIKLLIMGNDMGYWFDDILSNDEVLDAYYTAEDKAKKIANSRGIEYCDFIKSLEDNFAEKPVELSDNEVFYKSENSQAKIDEDIKVCEHVDGEQIEFETNPIESGLDVKMSDIIAKLIKDEYDAIIAYNKAIESAQLEGYDDIISQLSEIQAEENIHVEQLQEIMAKFDPNAVNFNDSNEDMNYEVYFTQDDKEHIDFNGSYEDCQKYIDNIESQRDTDLPERYIRKVIKSTVDDESLKAGKSLKESVNLNKLKNIINVLNKNLGVRFKHSAGGVFFYDKTPFNTDIFNKLIENNYKSIGDALEEQGFKYDISEDAYISKGENLYVTVYGDLSGIIVQFEERESEPLKESIDGWDERTGIIKRIDKYLYQNPNIEPPKGYVSPRSRDYEVLANTYGDYVTTPFSNISTDNLMSFAKEHNLIDESLNEDVPMEYIDPNILKSLADEDEYYNKQRERRIHNFELLHKIFDSHGYRDSEERWADKVFDIFRDAEEITVVDDASKVPNKTNDGQKVKYIMSTPDAEVDVHTDVYGDYVWVVTKDPITEAFYDTNKSLNEDIAEEDKFILYLPHLKPRTVDKETAIKSLEQKLNAFKSNDGSDIAGTGFAIYCLQSIDKDGTSWVANDSSREFIKSLTYLSESVEEDAYINEKFVGVEESLAPKDYKPKQTGTAYKVFKVKNGKLYPPMVANPGGEPTPVGVWLTADEGEFAGLSKTGRPQVKSIGSGTLSYRPGWHLGEIPRASQFDRTNKETGEKEFPKDFVWAECDYTMDIDYQAESDEQGHMRIDKDGNQYRSDKYQHSLAGLPKLPKDGYYKYRTNPRPDTVPWIITGAVKVNRLLSDDEVNDILKDHGIEPIHRQGGDKTLSELGLSNVHESVSYDEANRDEVYSDYNVAKARADELNLCLAEYGNINNISYCYWNKSGNRDDAAEIFVYYKFVGGKPEPLDDEEMQNIAMEYGVNFTN